RLSRRGSAAAARSRPGRRGRAARGASGHNAPSRAPRAGRRRSPRSRRPAARSASLRAYAGRDSLRAVRFESVLVVGAGQMGSGIAQVVAASGRRVSLYDAAPGAVERGLAGMRRSLDKLAQKGGAEPDLVLGRVEPADSIVPADLMIEAVVEDPSVKEEIFRAADGILPPEAILASNTSSIPIILL